jgi:hypothetical protein
LSKLHDGVVAAGDPETAGGLAEAVAGAVTVTTKAAAAMSTDSHRPRTVLTREAWQLKKRVVPPAGTMVPRSFGKCRLGLAIFSALPVDPPRSGL